MNTPGYEQLADVLQAAFDQAAKGKGAERHANDLPFHDQRMQSISAMLDTDAGMAFQVCKKIAEARGMSHAARERELLGAIVYTAGMIIFHRERHVEPAADAIVQSVADDAPASPEPPKKPETRQPEAKVSAAKLASDSADKKSRSQALAAIASAATLADPTGRPSWDQAPNWANYLTQNSKGVWVFWQNEPAIIGSGWVKRGGLFQEFNSGELAGNWKESLSTAPRLTKT